MRYTLIDVAAVADQIEMCDGEISPLTNISEI